MEKNYFSHRTHWSLLPNWISQKISQLRLLHVPLFDLTETNPTRCGLIHPSLDTSFLSQAIATPYEPEPLGHIQAREAIARYYYEHHVQVPVSNIVLSASTSEMYSWLFKLLTNRDDEILIPQPSYPLFTYLANLEEVRVTHYPLVRDDAWSIDRYALEHAVNDRTRAIVLVHPNNPTGSLTTHDECEWLENFAMQHQLALIVDEVFMDYVYESPIRNPSFAGRSNALTFVMNGLSKTLALPQLKLAWCAVSGPTHLTQEAMHRFELIADTYLSVNTPVQLALNSMLIERASIQQLIRNRIAHNIQTLDQELRRAGSMAHRLASEGGWMAIVRVPEILTEDEWIARLLDAGVVVHPGYFFDMNVHTRGAHLVLSLLPESTLFQQAVLRMANLVKAVSSSPVG